MKTFRYSTFKIDGVTCCAGDDENFPRCAWCADAEPLAAPLVELPPPDPYRGSIALRQLQNRRAPRTPEQQFEDQWKQQRAAEFARDWEDR